MKAGHPNLAHQLTVDSLAKFLFSVVSGKNRFQRQYEAVVEEDKLLRELNEE